MSNYVLTVDSQDYNLTLARTGGQGSKGNSITNAVIDASGDLQITISDASGAVMETINAGSVVLALDDAISIHSMNDVTLTAISDGDIIQYDGTTSQFVNHTLTTSKISDVDNTNLADGSMYVYNGTTNKHTATNELNNSNTTITGGTF